MNHHNRQQSRNSANVPMNPHSRSRSQGTSGYDPSIPNPPIPPRSSLVFHQSSNPNHLPHYHQIPYNPPPAMPPRDYSSSQRAQLYLPNSSSSQGFRVDANNAGLEFGPQTSTARQPGRQFWPQNTNQQMQNQMLPSRQSNNQNSPADDYYPSRQRNRNSSGQQHVYVDAHPPTMMAQRDSEETERLLGDNKVLQAENSQLRSMLDKNASTDAQLQLQIYNLQREVTAANEKVQQAKYELNSRMRTIDSQANEIADFKDKNIKLQDFVDTIAQNMEEAKKHTEELKSDIENLSGEREQLLMENREHLKSLDKLKLEYERLKAQCLTYQTRVANCKCASINLSDEPQALTPPLTVSGRAPSSTGNSMHSGSSGGAGDLQSATANNLSPSQLRTKPVLDEDSTREEIEPTQDWKRFQKQRSSIAHPPRAHQNLASQLDPLISLANQKSVSVEDINTLEKRAKVSNGIRQSPGMRYYQKHKSTSQSLSKLSNKLYHHQRNASNSKYSQHSGSKSSLGLSSGLYEELPLESAETQAELQQLNDVVPDLWNAHLVEVFFKRHLKMSDKVSSTAAKQIKSGKNLLELDAVSIKKLLAITDELQIRRILIHIKVVSNDTEMPQEAFKYPAVRKMDHLWIARNFLPHLGLQNLADSFEQNLIDMILLLSLNEKEIGDFCAKTTRDHKLAARSIHFGIRMLRDFDFRPQDFRRRRHLESKKLSNLLNAQKSNANQSPDSSTVGDLLVWSNEMLRDWLRYIDFDDLTVNRLTNTGINGCFIAYSPTFTAKELAVALGLKPENDNMDYRHLKEKFESLVDETRRQIKLARKENKKKSKQQSHTISNAEGQRILQEQSHNSVKRSLSNSLTKASRLIRRSGSRGSSRSGSREGSQDRRSVASTGAMTRDSMASTSTGISHPFSIVGDLSRPHISYSQH